MRNSWLIAIRELKERFSNGTFLWMMVLGPLCFLLFLFFLFKSGDEGKKSLTVLIADPAGLMDNKIVSSEGKNVNYYFIGDYLEIEEFRDGKAYQNFDALIEVNEKVLMNKKSFVFYRENPSADVKMQLKFQLERRVEEVMIENFTNLSVDQFRQIKQPLNVDFRNVYDPKNDKLFLRSQPMVWAQNAELKGTLMEITLKDSLVERIDITGNTSALMELDSGKYYNQIAGREMIAFFKNNELIRSDVKGNAWTIFYPEDEEKTDSLVTKKRMGMNRLFASDLRIYLDSGEVSGITYFDKPDGIFYPMDQIRTEEQFIKGFQWNPLLRPRDPIEMMKR